jgi:pimeloyl-ACP methyl ester carboxylesterase
VRHHGRRIGILWQPDLRGSCATRRSEASLCQHVLGTGPKVYYAEQGHPEGEAIVLVHGWPDSWFSFSRVLAMLPTHYHAVADDQRGFWRLRAPACCYGVDDLAADLVVFLDAVDIRRASLVGHSLGSFIARRVAESRPERVARLVLVSPAVTAANKVLVAAQASLRTLQNPVPPEFARQFQASTAYGPLPEAFFEQLVAESRKLPTPLWCLKHSVGFRPGVRHEEWSPSFTGQAISATCAVHPSPHITTRSEFLATSWSPGQGWDRPRPVAGRSVPGGGGPERHGIRAQGHHSPLARAGPQSAGNPGSSAGMNGHNSSAGSARCRTHTSTTWTAAGTDGELERLGAGQGMSAPFLG